MQTEADITAKTRLINRNRLKMSHDEEVVSFSGHIQQLNLGLGLGLGLALFQCSFARSAEFY